MMPVISGLLTPDSRLLMPDFLYLGDTTLATAAAYLAGVMHWSGWSYDYVPSDEAAAASLFEKPYRAYLLSDYMATRLSAALQRKLVEHVSQGAGLLMIGGWESYHGLGGNWDGTPVAEILPVKIADRDDRVNCDHPAFVQALDQWHAITRGLPWDERPPLIGGYNRIVPRAGATTLLEVARFSAAQQQGQFTLTPCGRDPLLVVSTHGRGRVAALATDVAPHWVGPWVDWGPDRVQAHGPGAGEVEVGNLYAQFFRQLVGWTSGLGQ